MHSIKLCLEKAQLPGGTVDVQGTESAQLPLPWYVSPAREALLYILPLCGAVAVSVHERVVGHVCALGRHFEQRLPPGKVS